MVCLSKLKWSITSITFVLYHSHCLAAPYGRLCSEIVYLCMQSNIRPNLYVLVCLEILINLSVSERRESPAVICALEYYLDEAKHLYFFFFKCYELAFEKKKAQTFVCFSTILPLLSNVYIIPCGLRWQSGMVLYPLCEGLGLHWSYGVIWAGEEMVCLRRTFKNYWTISIFLSCLYLLVCL